MKSLSKTLAKAFAKNFFNLLNLLYILLATILASKPFGKRQNRAYLIITRGYPVNGGCYLASLLASAFLIISIAYAFGNWHYIKEYMGK